MKPLALRAKCLPALVGLGLLASCSGAVRHDELLASRVSERVPRSELSTTLKVGDIVKVRTKADNLYTFRVTKVTSDSFSGRTDDKQLYKVPFAIIDTLHIRREKSGTEKAGDFIFAVFDCLDLRC